MSKSVLVMDMPSSCEKCKLHSFVGKDCDVVCQAKGTTQSYEDVYNGKPDWCPLKPMPEKITSWKGKSTNYQQGHRDGYNACIDELLKEE